MRRLGERAFRWIEAHTDAFFAATGVRRLKLLGELALITGTLRGDHEGAGALFDRAWAGLDQGAQIAAALPSLPLAATTYLPFALSGRRSAAVEARLARQVWPAELPPFHRYAIGVVLSLAGISRPWDDGDAALANRFFDTPRASTSALPAVVLAHAVMWHTSMGRAALPPATLALYTEASTHWHRALLAADLLDPLGEIVVADICAGLSPPSASLSRLHAAQRPDGALPPRTRDAIDTFDELYHPTLVAALAGTLGAREESAPLLVLSAGG